MAINPPLIDTELKLVCPICNNPYPFSLAGIMGFSLEGAYPTNVLGLLPPSASRWLRLQAGAGETVGAALVRFYPTDVVDLTYARASNESSEKREEQKYRAQIEEKMEKELASPHTYIFLCPKDQKPLQVMLCLDKDGSIMQSDIQAATVDNEALYETAKQIQANSLSVATSFCSAMVTISTGAVGIYTALLALVIPKSSSLLWPGDLLAVIPAIGFIAAALLFAFGAFPHLGSLRLAFPSSIEKFRQEAIAQRILITYIAFALLCVSLLLAFIFIAWIAGTPATISPSPSPGITPTATP